MKHYVVVAENPTALQQNAIMDNVIEGKYAYWHWISNVWLLMDANYTAQDDASTLRDKIRKVAPGLSFKVFEVQPGDWAGYSEAKWADWLSQYWKRW